MSKIESDRVIDLLIYKNRYVLTRKLNVFSENHNCKFVCKNCLNSYTCRKMLSKHKEKCEQKQEITTIKTSNEFHLYWKEHFHKNPSYFKIIADFEADNEIDDSCIGNKKKLIFVNKIQYAMVII